MAALTVNEYDKSRPILIISKRRFPLCLVFCLALRAIAAPAPRTESSDAPSLFGDLSAKFNAAIELVQGQPKKQTAAGVQKMTSQSNFRKNLNGLSADEQNILFDAMRPYVERHAVDHNAATPHYGPHFYVFHLRMIRELEDHLKEQGLGKFVPLPYWDPATPAPKIFSSALSASQTVKLEKGIVAPLPAILKFPDICDFKTVDRLTDDKLYAWHEPAHATLDFPNPLFWNYHAYVMDIYETWRNCPGAQLPVIANETEPHGRLPPSL